MQAFICDYVRTPIGRYGGALASVRTDDLAAIPIKKLLAQNASLTRETVDEVIFGCANQAGEDNRNVARMATLLSDLGDATPAYTINRLCASGLDAVIAGARAIRSAEQHVVIAGGIESMSRAPFVMPKAQTPYSRDSEIHDTTIGWRFVNRAVAEAYGTHSMPQTADNLAKELGVSREDQDAYALRSQRNHAKAQAEGFFEGEIAPVEILRRKSEPLIVKVDEHPRPQTTAESLFALKPINGPEYTVTAGNASGVNDGAAALTLASEAAVERLGLCPKARVVASASVGAPPRIMGIGPVEATRRALTLSGLTLDDIDVVEINEAFAAQVLACTRRLGIGDDDPRVNAKSGAIAMGHPLGMSGVRIAGTASRRLVEGGGRYALVTLCVGVGQGVALVLERV